MVIASGSQSAKKNLENYKSFIYTMKLIDVLPDNPNKETKKEYYSKVVAKVDVNHKEMTIKDLYKFRRKLEVVIMDIQEEICVLDHLEESCLKVHCFIPATCADKAFHSALSNQHKFHDLKLLYLQIGSYPVIISPLCSEYHLSQSPTSSIIAKSPKDFIDGLYEFLSVNMFPDPVVQWMIAESLICESTIMAVSNVFQTNCLLLEKLRQVGMQQLFAFCELLKNNKFQKNVGEVLTQALNSSTLDSNALEQSQNNSEVYSDTFKPELVIRDFLDMKIQLQGALEQCNAQDVVDKCSLLMACEYKKIPLFAAEILEKLKNETHTPSLILKLSPYFTWSDHSLLNEIIKACGNSKASMILSQFESKINPSLHVMAYPIPKPGIQMFPKESSTHSVLAVQLDCELHELHLQDIYDIRNFMLKKCKISVHTLQLLSVTEGKFTSIYWMILKTTIPLFTYKVLQFSGEFLQKGIVYVAIYPNVILTSGKTLNVGPLSFLTFSDEMIHAQSRETLHTQHLLSQLEELPKTITKLQFDLKEIGKEIVHTAEENEAQRVLVHDLNQKLEDNETYINSLKQSLVDEQKKLNDLQQEYDELQLPTTTHDIQMEIDKLQMSIDAAKDEIEAFKTQWEKKHGNLYQGSTSSERRDNSDKQRKDDSDKQEAKTSFVMQLRMLNEKINLTGWSKLLKWLQAQLTEKEKKTTLELTKNQQEVGKLKQQLTGEEERTFLLTLELIQIQQEVGKLKTKKDEETTSLRLKLMETQQEIETLKLQTISLSLQLIDNQQEVEKLKQQLTKNEKQTTSLRLQLTESQQEVGKLKEENVHVTQLNESMSMVNEQLYRDLNTETSQLNRELSKQKDRNSKLQEIIESTNIEVKSRKMGNTDLESLVKEMCEKIKTMPMIQDRMNLTQQQLLDLQSVIAARKSWVVSADQFHLGSEIGRSACAVVNQATFLGNRVAAKHFTGHISTSQSRKQLYQQAEIGFICQHPNIVKFWGASMEGGYPSTILLELMDLSLKDANKYGKAFKDHHINGIFHDIAKALNFLHSRPMPIIHGNIRSSSVMLKGSQNDGWLAKLKYVGTSEMQGHAELLHSEDKVYAAPEASQQCSASEKMDVYSFGIILLETLMKTHPSFNEIDTLKAEVKQHYPKYSQLLVSCTEYKPSERPTVYDVLSQLENK